MEGVGDSRRIALGSEAPESSPRRTKIKVSGGTQTNGGNRGNVGAAAPHSSRRQRIPSRTGTDNSWGNSRTQDFEGTKEQEMQDLYVNSPQKTATGIQLSDSTRERLLASQCRSGSPGGSGYAKSRTRRMSRERAGLQTFKTFANGYYSDSSDCLYGEGQPVEERGWNVAAAGQTGWHQNSAASGVWQATSSAAAGAGQPGARYNNSTWTQQPGYNSLDNYYSNRDNNRETMRGANSLESLDSVSSSIQQARALSIPQNNQENSGQNQKSTNYSSKATKPSSYSTQTTNHTNYSSQSPKPSKYSKQSPNPSNYSNQSPNLSNYSNNSPQPTRINRSNSVSNQISSGAPEFQRTFPLRKPSAADDSEYYGVPLQIGRAAAAAAAVAKPNQFSSPRTMPRNSANQAGHSASQPLDEGQAGSMSSLASVGHLSSVSFIAEEKVNSEIQRLRKELREEQNKVKRLTSQLSTNTHVVSAFEQSLSNMTTRLQQLTRSADEKDKELHELHKTIENLRKQGASLGLGSRGKYPGSSESLFNNKNGFISGTSDSENDENHPISRKTFNFKNRKSRWLQQSISKAFSRSRKNSGSVSEAESGKYHRQMKTLVDTGTSCPGSPTPKGHHRSKSAPVLDEGDGDVEELRQQLLQKESLLTETRLEALTSAHQLQSLRETVAKLRSDLNAVRRENERLHGEKSISINQSISSPSVHRSAYSPMDGSGLPSNPGSVERRPKKAKNLSSYSESPIRRQLGSSGAGMADDRKGCSLLHTSCSLDTDAEEVCVPVSVISTGSARRPEVKIGYVTLSRNSSWVKLDDCLRGLVKTYLNKLDPDNSLELSNQSMVCYQCGNIRRVFKNPEPDGGPSLLPDTRIWVSFRGGTDRGSLEDLAFNTLIPKNVMKKYVMTLSKYQRAVIVGHSGVGKTFLAKKLAEFLVLKSGEELTTDSIRLLLTNKATVEECCEFLAGLKLNQPGRHPAVIILENIESQGSKILQILSRLEMSGEDFPFIICTSQPTEYIRDVSSRYGFAEITIGEDVELIQGFLGRYLRRKMLSMEVSTRLANFDMPEAIQWILRIYCNIYIFVKTTSKTRSCLSPQMFLGCPVDSTQSLRSWFIDLWNSTLVFYLRQVVGSRGDDHQEYEDPVRFVIRTWPWQDQLGGLPQALLKVKTELRTAGGKDESAEDDPLLSMLMCLQEAALYSGESENMSSNTSLHKLSSSDFDLNED